MEPISILYLEDSPIDMDFTMSILGAAEIANKTVRVETEQAFRSALEQGQYDLILADYALPDFDGVSALQIAQQERPDIPFIFVSGAIGEEVAVDSLQRGATDFVLKQRMQRLVPAVRRAITEAAERKARRAAEEERRSLLEKEQIRAEELAQANAQLEQFAYAASHDLQEPLRMVKIYAQLLSRNYRSVLDDSGVEFLGHIETGVTRMEKLIRDLLSYSRAIHGGSEGIARVDLDEIFRQVLGYFEGPIAEHGAAVHVEQLPSVWADPERIAYVFQNLISNSLKYRAAEAPRIHVSSRKQGDEWVISIQDNGIGFESKYSERVFGLFKRLHGSEYPGTGVGLALAKQIIEQHGGRIWVNSELGQGATFRFTLRDSASSRPQPAPGADNPDAPVPAGHPSHPS